MSARIYPSDFLRDSRQKKEAAKKINFDRLVDVMSKTKFYQFERLPTVAERPAAERDMDSFHAARLFDLSDAWADPSRSAEAKLEKIEKIEDFAATLFLKDIRSGKFGVWVLPPSDESTDEEIKVQLREFSAEAQKKMGKDYHSPTLVHWLSLHGFDDTVLKKCFDETYNLIQEDASVFSDIENEAESAQSSSSILSCSGVVAEEQSCPMASLSKFPLDTQITLFYKYLFSAFLLAFYEGEEKQLSIGEADFLDGIITAQKFRLLIRTMIAKTCAEISVLNAAAFSSLPPTLKSPVSALQSPQSPHIHRRRLSAAAQFSHHREEVTHSCLEIYHANPLHFVLDYLDSQMANYDMHSKDWEILSQKRDLVTTICRKVDVREISLVQGVNDLLREDKLYQRRNVWDCLHRTPRTVRLIEACLEGASEVEKLLPKAALGKARHSKIKRVIEEITVI